MWPQVGTARGGGGTARLNPTAQAFVPRSVTHALAPLPAPPPTPPADAWPQPLSTLEAGVALCLLVVREPEHGLGAHAASWPVGCTPAQRLLLRARASQHGTRLPPHHVELCARSFPPPWQRLGQDWLDYARHICALDQPSFWQAWQLLAEDRSLAPAASIEAARTAGWSQLFALALRRRYDAAFCAPAPAFDCSAPEGVHLHAEGWQVVGGRTRRQKRGFAQFTGQAYAFGAVGPRALRLIDVDPPATAAASAAGAVSFAGRASPAGRRPPG